VRRVAGLLRAVNVGGRKLLMADLTRITREAGFDAPETLLASGNVAFGTTLSNEISAARLAAAILNDVGMATEVMVRDHAGISAVMAANPFPGHARDDPSRLMAMFLDRAPTGDLEALAPACVAGEQVRAGPECLFIWYPQGAGTSKLTTAVIERRLKVCGTMRNWNTVGKLAALVNVG
jgi:uncharacterized protein (DUF1697 family)